MAIDRDTSAADASGESGSEQRDQTRNPPPDRPGVEGFPSRAESRAGAAAANKDVDQESDQMASDSAKDKSALPTAGKSGVEQNKQGGCKASGAEADKEQSTGTAKETIGGKNGASEQQRSASSERSANERGSSENAQDLNSESKKSASFILEYKAIKDKIDPFRPNFDEAEGSKGKYRWTAREGQSEWTDGVGSLRDLPDGEELGERDEDRRTKSDRFLGKIQDNLDDINDQLEKTAGDVSDLFKPPPTGQAETRADNSPVAVDVHQSGVDPGNAATAVLVAGIVAAEAFRRGRDKIRERSAE
ncbi:hypothetical protein [Actinoallomurus sp. NPDC050550]|uniref:hypothetical protein n=1 Tax=Actinoallomurus sp. NPDC050550 TaxID=3154937 RepID=UPI0033C29B29